jgi:hypothetical protein
MGESMLLAVLALRKGESVPAPGRGDSLRLCRIS